MERKSFVLSLMAFLVLAIAFYGLDQYAISDYDDDVYKFVTKNVEKNYIEEALNGTETFVPIESIKDIFDSQKNFYLTSNGRFIIQGTAQFFSSFVSMDTFVVINTFVFVLFFYIVIKLSLKKNTLIGILFVITSFWLFTYKGVGFLGSISGSTNYLWAALAYFSYYYLFERLDGINASLFLKLLLFLISILVGSLSESFCLGFLCAYILYCLLNKKSILSSQSIMVVGFLLGACVCVFAPGNFLRAEGRVHGLSVNFSALYQVLSTPLVFFFFASFFFLMIHSVNKAKDYILHNQVLIISLLINIAFAVFIAYNSKSQLTCVCIISLILISRLIFDTIELQSNSIKCVVSLMVLICLVSYKPIYDFKKGLYLGYQNAIAQAIKGNEIIIDGEYEKYRYKIMSNPLVRDYFAYNISFQKIPVSLRLTNGKSRSMIKKVLPYRPEKIDEMCMNSQLVCKGLYKIPNNFYVYKSSSVLPEHRVTIDYYEHYAIFLLKHHLSHSLPLESFEFNNSSYFVFPNTLQYGRIVSVTEHNV